MASRAIFDRFFATLTWKTYPRGPGRGVPDLYRKNQVINVINANTVNGTINVDECLADLKSIIDTYEYELFSMELNTIATEGVWLDQSRNRRY